MLYKAKWASATYLAQQMRGARGGSQAQAGEQPAHTGANGPGGKQLRAAQPGDMRPAQAGERGGPLSWPRPRLWPGRGGGAVSARERGAAVG